MDVDIHELSNKSAKLSWQNVYIPSGQYPIFYNVYSQIHFSRI